MLNKKEAEVSLLLERLSASTGQFSGNLLLKGIDRFSGDSDSTNDHTNHCSHSRSGGMHVNVCFDDNPIGDLIKSDNQDNLLGIERNRETSK
ncbi:hypothetical protein [Wolbachia endosymbiont of Folsomia candida]|uniref:hypothetical protein n=1 Tax=Wolbachia endosymbiont of Folsomia candida TaxID=169402 RepID=UPI000A95BC12|nr:hypothetical protein [Wolbachia endosymbiont of Folsomia candida]APR99095.1 hypothetical protein ASM33_07915 [Wolbachia endosymbiont of Folsomia candida]